MPKLANQVVGSIFSDLFVSGAACVLGIYCVAIPSASSVAFEMEVQLADLTFSAYHENFLAGKLAGVR